MLWLFWLIRLPHNKNPKNYVQTTLNEVQKRFGTESVLEQIRVQKLRIEYLEAYWRMGEGAFQVIGNSH